MDSTVFSHERLRELIRDQHRDTLPPLYSSPKLHDTVTPSSIEDHFNKLQHEAIERKHQNRAVEEFKKSYIKIRTDNIILDHSTAIELVKMIHSEADTFTYKDIQ